MVKLIVGKTYNIIPKSLEYNYLTLYQDELIKILKIYDNRFVEILRLKDNTVHTVEKIALELTVE